MWCFGIHSPRSSLVDIDTQLSQVGLSLVNLRHQLLVRLGDIVEGHDVVAESGEEVCAEGNESPEGELRDDC